MKAPKCNLCGHHHWAREAHVFDKKRVIDVEVKTKTKATPDRIEKIVGPTKAATKSEKNRRPRVKVSAPKKVSKTKQGWDRKKYNKYQRDLMRKIRAAKRRGDVGAGSRGKAVHAAGRA